MTQDERWNERYNEVVDFIIANKRNPSKHYPEEKLMHHWVHHNRKQVNAGTLKAERVESFSQLLALMEENKHKNQYE